MEETLRVRLRSTNLSPHIRAQDQTQVAVMGHADDDHGANLTKAKREREQEQEQRQGQEQVYLPFKLPQTIVWGRGEGRH